MTLLQIGDAAKILGVHPQTLRRWCIAEQIPHYVLPGGQRRFDEEDLKQWLRDRKWSSNGQN